MIKFNLEFRKGILFVRVENKINKKNYDINNDKLNKIIKNIGIKYIVMNFDTIKKTDYFNIKFIINNYDLIRKNNGKLFLIGNINNKIVNMFSNMKMNIIESELEAFNKI